MIRLLSRDPDHWTSLTPSQCANTKKRRLISVVQGTIVLCQKDEAANGETLSSICLSCCRRRRATVIGHPLALRRAVLIYATGPISSPGLPSFFWHTHLQLISTMAPVFLVFQNILNNEFCSLVHYLQYNVQPFSIWTLHPNSTQFSDFSFTFRPLSAKSSKDSWCEITMFINTK